MKRSNDDENQFKRQKLIDGSYKSLNESEYHKIKLTKLKDLDYFDKLKNIFSINCLENKQLIEINQRDIGFIGKICSLCNFYGTKMEINSHKTQHNCSTQTKILEVFSSLRNNLIKFLLLSGQIKLNNNTLFIADQNNKDLEIINLIIKAKYKIDSKFRFINQ